MNKHDVMKALALCSSHGGDACAKCPYTGTNNCYIQMTHDAITLLESNDTKSNDTKPTYHTAIIYTKHTNLMPWLQSNYERFGTHGTTEQAQRIREMYSKDREVQLILLVRHEDVRIGGTIKNKCICRIKCPINPLPIKGEFECVSTGEMTRLLASMGWKYKEKVHYSMFK